MGGPVPRPAGLRFWAKVDRTDENACWLWTAKRKIQGYGSFYVSRDRPAVLAHRYAYEILRGPIPSGMELDHLCRVHACVNPDHLEPVTHLENVRRGQAGRTTAERCASRTHCKNGHELTADNVYLWQRGNHTTRNCRTCRRDLSRVYARRRRQSQGVRGAARDLAAEPFTDAP